MINRPTSEVILLLMSATVAVLFVLIGAGIVVVVLFRPEVDVGVAVEGFGHAFDVLVGIVAGFLVGKGRKEPPS